MDIPVRADVTQKSALVGIVQTRPQSGNGLAQAGDGIAPVKFLLLYRLHIGTYGGHDLSERGAGRHLKAETAAFDHLRTTAAGLRLRQQSVPRHRNQLHLRVRSDNCGRHVSHRRSGPDDQHTPVRGLGQLRSKGLVDVGRMILNLGCIAPRRGRRITRGHDDLIGKPLSTLRTDHHRPLKIERVQRRDFAGYALELQVRRRSSFGLRQIVLQIFTIEGTRQVALGVDLGKTLTRVINQVIRILGHRRHAAGRHIEQIRIRM